MKNLIVVIPLLLFFSCSVIDSDFHEKNIELGKIQGEWEVKRISGGFGGGEFFPNPEGVSVFSSIKSITVSIDYDEVKWFVDGELSIVHRIKYEEKSDSKLTFEMQSRPKDQLNVVDKYLYTNLSDKNKFSLFDSCFDCFSYDLVRQ